MKIYNNIDDFLFEAFPTEIESIIKKNKTNEENCIENADAEFNSELEAIIKGEKTAEKDDHGQ